MGSGRTRHNEGRGPVGSGWGREGWWGCGVDREWMAGRWVGSAVKADYHNRKEIESHECKIWQQIRIRVFVIV